MYDMVARYSGHGRGHRHRCFDEVFNPATKETYAKDVVAPLTVRILLAEDKWRITDRALRYWTMPRCVPFCCNANAQH